MLKIRNIGDERVTAENFRKDAKDTITLDPSIIKDGFVYNRELHIATIEVVVVSGLLALDNLNSAYNIKVPLKLSQNAINVDGKYYYSDSKHRILVPECLCPRLNPKLNYELTGKESEEDLMLLDEVILHTEDVAEKECHEKCAAEHKQLAKWLKELRQYRIQFGKLV